MTELLDAALGFPAVLFGPAVVVIAGFWLLVLIGAAERDSFEGDVDTGAAGLGGVPVTVSVSLLALTAWLAGLTGTVLLHRTELGGLGYGAAATGLLAVTVLIAWRATALLVRPLRKLVPAEPEPSRRDFVGRTCTIRTGRVDSGFGRAEVAARDGSTAVVQVRQARQTGRSGLTAGSTALLHAYDDDREFFWVAPYEPASGRRRTAA